MKLLVIGGSGQLSGRLAQMALAQGHEVWAVTRGNRPVPQGVHALQADRRRADDLRAALESAHTQWDAALDCICMSAEDARIDLNVLPAFTRRAVVVSTDSVYHPLHKRVPQDEQSDFYMADGGYGHHKRQMEEAFLASDRLAFTLFRPGHIFGPGFLPGCYPEQSRQKSLLSHMRAGKPLRLVDGGSFLVHPIFVDDLAQAMLDCIQNPQTIAQIYCIGGPDVITNAEYYHTLGRILQTQAVIESIPLEGYLDAHPECSGHLCHRSYTLDKMKRHGLRLPRTTLEEGLLLQVQWLDKQEEQA